MVDRLVSHMFDQSPLLFPPEWTRASLVFALMTVWVVVALFAYLNRHRRQPYFSLWTAAWTFYSVYLAALIGLSETPDAPFLVMALRACIGISALFMFWGSFELAGCGRNQRELGCAIVMMVIWSYIAAYEVREALWITLPVFGLLAGAGVYTGTVYVRRRRHYKRAWILGVGFALWGMHLLAFPFVGSSNVLAAGTYICSSVLAMMITVGMVVEQEATASERDYRALFESASDAIFLLEPGTLRILEANRAAHGLVLDGAAQSEGSFLDLCPNLCSNGDKTPDEAELVASVTKPGVEFRLPRSDGTTITCEASAAVVDCPRGRVLQINLRDLTERKRLEAQFLQSQKREAVGRLAGGVAHDFNNILTLIMGYSDLALRTSAPDGAVRRNIEDIRQSAKRAANLTRHLLAFSRKQTLQPMVFELNAVVADMDDMLRRLIGEDVKLNTLLGADLGCVKADPGQIEQVIMNLAVNARDAMPSGGFLTIETANVTLDENYTRQRNEVVPGLYVMISVTDSGTGMTEEVTAHLFEPFFTTKPQGQGTGLGLATCYGIVKQSGGHISFYTEPGKGTTFIVYLPRVEADAKALPKPDEGSQSPARGTESVLLVEDEPALRDLASFVLRDLGYPVVEAANGLEALRLVDSQQDRRFDLVVTDVIMPRMGGKELADQLRIRNRDAKVLFMSGYTADAIVDHGVLEPGIAFLQKPFSPATLACTVREVLDRN